MIEEDKMGAPEIPMLHRGIEYTVKRAATPDFRQWNFVLATRSRLARRKPN
jgi:hypothetical protein